MNTKLTLTVDKSIIEGAKIFAKKTGKSLSGLVENYLQSLIADSQKDEELSPRLKKIVGRVKVPKDFDVDKALDEYYTKKHL